MRRHFSQERRRSASSHGSKATAPVSISRKRFSISSSQACSAPSSISWSRLSPRDSARAAHRSGARDNACFKISAGSRRISLSIGCEVEMNTVCIIVGRSLGEPWCFDCDRKDVLREPRRRERRFSFAPAAVIQQSHWNQPRKSFSFTVFWGGRNKSVNHKMTIILPLDIAVLISLYPSPININGTVPS